MENEKNELMISNINELGFAGTSKQKVFTTITDGKVIFNLESTVDYKLNDCKGETIKVKDFLIKVIEKKMENPEVDEATGEIIKDKEYKRITILIDEDGKSYVTASNFFTIQFIKAVQFISPDVIKEEGLVIKIKDVPVKNSNNKALGFELV